MHDQSKPGAMGSWKKSQIVIETGSVKAQRCPCCSAKTLHGRGQFELCPVCYWEDDGMDEGNTRLEEARANYQRFGACDERWRHAVRRRRTSER